MHYLEAEALSHFGIGTRAIVLMGYTLFAGNNSTLEQFLQPTEEQIFKQLSSNTRNVIWQPGDIIVLDIENPIHPRFLYQYLDRPELFKEIVHAFRKRVRAAQAVFPGAIISLYGVLTPHGQSSLTSSSTLQYFDGANAAAKLGMFDEVDAVTPVLYSRWDEDDSHCDKLKAAIDATLILTAALRTTNDEPIKIIPLLSFLTLNGASKHNTERISSERFFAIFEYLQPYVEHIPSIVIWTTKNTAEVADYFSAHNIWSKRPDKSVDYCDSDEDKDSIPDKVDLCPMTPNQKDMGDLDQDGLGDLCDRDIDGDKVDNLNDNCLRVSNSSQYDIDGDGQGDSCDSKTINCSTDSLINNSEVRQYYDEQRVQLQLATEALSQSVTLLKKRKARNPLHWKKIRGRKKMQKLKELWRTAESLISSLEESQAAKLDFQHCSAGADFSCVTEDYHENLAQLPQTFERSTEFFADSTAMLKKKMRSVYMTKFEANAQLTSERMHRLHSVNVCWP